MRYTNLDKLPEPIFEAIKNRPYDREGADISVTGLIGPPRVFQMVERMGDKLTQEASDSLYALDGSAMHEVLKWAGLTLPSSDYIIEQRFFVEVMGWKVSGQMDVVHIPTCTLQDYKKCSRKQAQWGVKDEWTAQLNVYRWMLKQHGITVNTLEICAIFKDWSKGQTLRDKSYPKKGFEVMPIEVWDLKRTEQYVHDRVSVHQEAAMLPTDKLPLCTQEEQWKRSDGFAVMVGQEKRARRVLDSRQAALNWMAENLQPNDMAKAKIEGRESEPTRCQLWCPVRFHCDFGKRWARK